MTYRRMGLLIAVSMFMGRSVSAYQTAGHFYSVIAELAAQDANENPFTLAQVKAVAFCAQLPDLSKEFDAITVRAEIPIAANVSWGLFSQCWTRGVRHMVAVQHYVHALTGGSHAQTLDAARATLVELRSRIKQDPNNLANACALGLATHLLGDAFAHERMDGSGQQYATGLGHFRDDTQPDHPLVRSDRLALWQGYLEEARSDLHASLTPAKLAAIDAVGKALFDGATRKPNVDESGLIKGLEGTLGSQEATWIPFKPSLEALDAGEYLLSSSCESVAQRYSDVLGIQIDCNAAWQTYLNVVSTSFSSLPPACELEASERSL